MPTPPPKNRITGMGSALVDLFADISDAQLAELGSPKASSTLVSAHRTKELAEFASIHTRLPGGSAANTIAGIAALGVPTGFIGKIGNDEMGRFFADAFTKLNVRFPAPTPPPNAPPTGHCVVLVTPDGERTMHTVLGAAVTLAADDVDTALLADTNLLFAEAYVLDSETMRDAFLFAAHTIRANGGRVGLSLADAQCVDRHRDMLKNLLTDKIDIVLANEAEARALAPSDTIDDINATAAWLHAQKPNGGLDGAITLSAKGALVLGAKPHHVAAEKIDDVVDLTGAGDQFAAGFLGGLMYGKSPQQAAEIGVIMASEVIRHFGPRPQHDIKKVMAAHNLRF